MKLHFSYSDQKSTIPVRDEIIEVRAYQMIVWVSVVPDFFKHWDPQAPKLPAILDTGNNHNFAITKDHLLRWAGIQVSGLVEKKHMRERGVLVPLHDAGLWLHADAEPFNLAIDDGIAVYDGNWPRLPTLGLRALTNNGLQSFIYGDTKEVVIRTPPAWWWPF